MSGQLQTLYQIPNFSGVPLIKIGAVRDGGYQKPLACLITLTVINALRYLYPMIRSFHDRRTAALFLGKRIKGIDPLIQERARVRLLQIDRAG